MTFEHKTAINARRQEAEALSAEAGTDCHRETRPQEGQDGVEPKLFFLRARGDERWKRWPRSWAWRGQTRPSAEIAKRTAQKEAQRAHTHRENRAAKQGGAARATHTGMKYVAGQEQRKAPKLVKANKLLKKAKKEASRAHKRRPGRAAIQPQSAMKESRGHRKAKSGSVLKESERQRTQTQQWKRLRIMRVPSTLWHTSEHWATDGTAGNYQQQQQIFGGTYADGTDANDLPSDCGAAPSDGTRGDATHEALASMLHSVQNDVYGAGERRAGNIGDLLKLKRDVGARHYNAVERHRYW